jgi:hypothetical protein
MQPNERGNMPLCPKILKSGKNIHFEKNNVMKTNVF